MPVKDDDSKKSSLNRSSIPSKETVTSTSSSHLVLKEGWLTKQGKFIRNWRPRWVQLVQGMLYYYKEPAHETEPTNAFVLAGTHVKPNEKLGPYCFELILANRERRFMAATSLEERDAWIQAIQLASRKLTEGSPNSKLSPTNTTHTTSTTTTNVWMWKESDFEFIKVLGKGNYGKVLLARSKNVDHAQDQTDIEEARNEKEGEEVKEKTKRVAKTKLYAVKVVKKSALVDVESLEHLLSENRVLQTIQHPFLVKLYASFQTPERLYFVMEYVKGGELFFHILKERKFSETRVQLYIGEILLGLMHLHEHGIVYRDLKLENILLDEEGHIKITDFGLCKEGIGQNDVTSTFCGTPEYLAPEILEEENYGRSVDWWALGIVMYELLIGKPPFGAPESIEKLFQAILHSPIPMPETLSMHARSLLDALLTRDCTKRIGSGPEDGKEIQSHPFFNGLDWDRLLKKQFIMPFIPPLTDPTDASNFDPEFTQLPAELTPCSSIPEMEPINLNP
ncbi:RAC-gamma serine/threonine-protein kinase [Coelomomyces lativittatus]|nr:RAC-gamma serine/threonine-protein kinase [Coelomomyces lativittatus]